MCVFELSSGWVPSGLGGLDGRWVKERVHAWVAVTAAGRVATYPVIPLSFCKYNKVWEVQKVEFERIQKVEFHKSAIILQEICEIQKVKFELC